MAIGFARLEFVQRSTGKTACGKSAYNARERIYFEGTAFVEAKVFDWSHQEKPIYHGVLLPEGVSPSFHSLETLWNMAEQKENRHNSQVAMEMVVALPDDQVISLEDKINLIETFVEEHFTKKGLAAQIDIHSPDKKTLLSPETGEIENFDHNWHAHILVPTRRFKANGQELEDHKARDLMPSVRGGKVVSGQQWGKLWAQHQNLFFEEKGINLHVDDNGIVSQIHLGPVRMRGRAFALEAEQQTVQKLNYLEAKDPCKILDKITETRSLFTPEDVERFIHKHVEPKFRDDVREAFWQQKRLVQLMDKKTEQPINKFTSQEVFEEEKQILRLADSLYQTNAFKLKTSHLDNYTATLNFEQKRAFENITKGQRISCIEGHAGTGKSYLLASLREAYEQQGYAVRAFGPDNATVEVLKDKGFAVCENIYRFLFSLHHQKREIVKSKEVWIIDETSKLGNRPLLELLKEAEKYQAQLIFAGCSAQLSSVERGGLFKVFCSRYGAEELVDIQRQKTQEQRVMAKNLACGKMAVAIDQLAGLKGLKWQETRAEAIEELIKTWAVDQTKFSFSSALILAHSNAEVRMLNEMARLYRKEKGELMDTEYVCKTVYGKIIVSQGDKIEFRHNDKELGITNGMRGTLVEANEGKFTVALQGQSRKIDFDPESYTGFQLGYATTYHRSQGQTVERAYVLYSPQMNKEKFYVSLTRHVHKVSLFAARTDVSCMADLKRQAFRKDPKETTLLYTTKDELEQYKRSLERQEHIECLKESTFLLSRAKGYTLGVWNHLKTTLDERSQRSNDLRPNVDFFQPELSQEKNKGLVFKINDQSSYDQVKYLELQNTFGKILDKRSFSLPASPPNSSWEKLNDSNKAFLSHYYQAVNQASALYTIVKSEVKGENLKQAPHFKEWQIGCSTRNKQAYHVLQTIPKAFAQEAMGTKAFQILQERASKHEAIQQKHTTDFVQQLKENIEPLLYCLFPEGPSGRNQKGLRFGNKGSLAVTCQGQNKGCFYDFEKGQGGGPFKLVQHVLDLNNLEAQEWVKGFLGQSKEYKTPSFLHFRSQAQEKNIEWHSLKADSSHPAPDFKEIGAKLSQRYNEMARHAYRDENGELLFYTLRLTDKEDASKKIVLPLSYGKWQGAETPSWCLKSYQTHERTLYGLEKLKDHPKATILIVEGEKTADAAQKLLVDKDVLCVTWQGGAAAVSKTNWAPLHAREIVIWPDNDTAGFKAAEMLCSELRRIGVKSLSIVNQNVLTKDFPPKWDLADPLPNDKKLQDIQHLILTAKEKTLGIELLSANLKGDKVDKLRAHDMLWRVEERLWTQLEEKHAGRIWDIKQTVLNETLSLFDQNKKLEKHLQKDYQCAPEMAMRMAYHLTLYEAERGKKVSSTEIENLRQTIADLKQHPLDGAIKYKSDHQLAAYAVDKALLEASKLGISGKNLQKEVNIVAKSNINYTFRHILEKEQTYISHETSKGKNLDLTI